MTCQCPEEAEFKCDRCKKDYCKECMHFNVLNAKRNLCCSCKEQTHLYADWVESMVVGLMVELRECNRIITQLRKEQL